MHFLYFAVTIFTFTCNYFYQPLNLIVCELFINKRQLMEDKRVGLLKSMGYSDKAIELLTTRANLEEMENPTIMVKHQGSCGDVIILYLKIENNQIQDAKFEFIGCAGLQSTGSALTEMVKDVNLKKALKIDSSDIIHFLGSLPKAKYECADICRDALKKAINDYQTETISQ